MTTTPEQFQEILAAPEGTRIEFKSATGNFHFEKLVEYCVAIANEGGGKIILGVSDERPRTVVGTGAYAEPGRTEAGLHQRLGHRIPVEECHHDGKRVLIIHVPTRLPGTAWSINGKFLKRAGDDLTGMSDGELREIFAEAGPDFSAEPCPAGLGDLAPEAISEFRRRWARKAANPRIEAWSDEETLTSAELLVEGKLNYAALILLGTRAALGRHLGQAEVVFEYRSSEASGPAADREDYRGGFFLFHDALWQKINLRNDRQSYQDGLFRYDIPTFDETAVREALLNAIAHRDYRLGGSVFVRQYSRRLEIVSPGGFPVGITAENILDQQNPRNRRLSEALARCGLIERSGQGLNLMVENAIRQSKPLPDFSGSAPHEVRLKLEGTVQNPLFIRFLDHLGEDRLAALSTLDFLVLDLLQRKQQVPPAWHSRILSLKDAGVIESVGRGRGTKYILSQQIQSKTGQGVVDSQAQGLDREANKKLLLAYIKKSPPEGAKFEELSDLLQGLTRDQLKGLMKELKAEGKIVSQGERKAGRWLPSDSKPGDSKTHKTASKPLK